ncbi:hypothetical protein NUM3379_23120 [Kineococcus sp. NUM-3379]
MPAAPPTTTTRPLTRVLATASLLYLGLLPVLVLGLLLAVTLLVVAVGSAHAVVAVKVAGLLLVPLVVGAWRAVASARRARSEPTPGVELTRSAHPRLWAEIDELAASVVTAAPVRAVLTPDVNAAVTEATGRRELVLGLPLLTGTTRAELRSVLAHELGHFGEGHTRALARTRRLTDGLGGLLDHLRGPVRLVFSAYARGFGLLASAANRQQELDADAHSARLAGPAAAASALRRTAELDVAWDHYCENYLQLSVPAQRRPDVVGGFHHLLQADAERLSAVADEVLAEQGRGSFLDSHPSTPQRIARFEALAGPAAATPDRAGGAAPAWTLLGTAPDEVTAMAALRAATVELFQDDDPPADWPELVTLGTLNRLREMAGHLARAATSAGLPGPVTAAAVLDAVERGEGQRLAAPLTNPALPAEEVEQARAEVLAELLGALVVVRLAECGRVRVVLDWTGPPAVEVVDPAGEPVPGPGVRDLVERAVAEPATGVPVLRELLAGAGAAQGAVAAVAEPEPDVVAAFAQVTTARRRHDLLVCTSGLLLVPCPKPGRLRAGLSNLTSGVLGDEEKADAGRIASLAGQGVRACAQLPGARFVDTDEVVAARLRPRVHGWQLRLRLAGGEELEVRTTLDVTEHGSSPAEELGMLLGSRLDRERWEAAPR